ncbi:MAG: hypothetical protein IT285_04325 [Bdellovibrionales bacterium]|nr:hypothetical protein [Bdellovibrionales bacterium]
MAPLPDDAPAGSAGAGAAALRAQARQMRAFNETTRRMLGPDAAPVLNENPPSGYLPYFPLIHAASQLRFNLTARQMVNEGLSCQTTVTYPDGRPPRVMPREFGNPPCPAPRDGQSSDVITNTRSDGRVLTTRVRSEFRLIAIPAPLPDEHRACVARMANAVHDFLRERPEILARLREAPSSTSSMENPGTLSEEDEEGMLEIPPADYTPDASGVPASRRRSGVSFTVLLTQRNGRVQCAVPSTEQLQSGLDRLLSNPSASASFDINGLILRFTGRAEPGHNPFHDDREMIAMGEQSQVPIGAMGDGPDYVSPLRDSPANRGLLPGGDTSTEVAI